MPAPFRPPSAGDLGIAVRRLRADVDRLLTLRRGRVEHRTTDPAADEGVDVWIRDDTSQLCYRLSSGAVRRLTGV
jgi:hypothetical protein